MEPATDHGTERRSPPRPVLVIDDHALFAKTLCLTLTDCGFDAICAVADGISFILWSAELCEPGLAVLDLHLGREPDGRLIDPIMLTHTLRGSGWTVLAITPSAQDHEKDETAAAVIAAGAIGLAHKASPLEELLAAIRAGVAGEPVMTEAQRAIWLARHRGHQDRRSALEQRIGRLDAREREILGLLGQGQHAREIAEHFAEPLSSVRAQIRQMLRKLECTSSIEAIVLARQLSA